MRSKRYEKKIHITCPVTEERVTVKCEVLINEISLQQEPIEELLTKIKDCTCSEFMKCNSKCEMALKKIIARKNWNA